MGSKYSDLRLNSSNIVCNYQFIKYDVEIFNSSRIEICCLGSESIRKKSLYLRMRASLHAQDIYNLLSHICNLCCTNVMYLSITNRAKMTDMDEEMCLGMLDISFPYYLIQRFISTNCLIFKIF